MGNADEVDPILSETMKRYTAMVYRRRKLNAMKEVIEINIQEVRKSLWFQ